jgi:3-methylcrotonyl-CoA carboxylase beta subunit
VSREALKFSRRMAEPCSRLSTLPRWTCSRSVTTYCPPNQANAISVLPTIVDPSSEEYKENERQMGEVMARLEQLTNKIRQGGSLKAREKHIARKKMLPRDRVTALIDPGTSFLELSALAGHDVYPEADVPAGGIITGVGVIEGVTCMIVANDSTVKGGTYYPITVKKHLRAQAIAQENNLPYALRFISLLKLLIRLVAFISLIPAVPISRTKQMFFPIETISGVYFSTRRE